MQDDLDGGVGINGDKRMQLVEELQLAKRSTLQSVRHVLVRPVAVEIRPADSARRQELAVSGTTRELKTQSATIELRDPVAIGGFYQINFDTSSLDVSPAFARCDQITLVAEDRFDARFQFLQAIVMPPEGEPVDGHSVK